MMKALKFTLLIAAVCVPTAFVAEKAQAYESWEIPFSKETFNAPMKREQGGQQYGDNWCQRVWNERSNWNSYVASVDGRQIATLSVNHIWYHWDNRQCIANINGTSTAYEFKDLPVFTDFFFFPDSTPQPKQSNQTDFFFFPDSTPQPKQSTGEVVTLFIQDSDLNYNCVSVYGSQAYLSESKVANPDLFICKAPVGGTHTFGADASFGTDPVGGSYAYTTPPGESVDKPALSKKHLCGNAAANANGGDWSKVISWRYDANSNQCYATTNVY